MRYRLLLGVFVISICMMVEPGPDPDYFQLGSAHADRLNAGSFVDAAQLNQAIHASAGYLINQCGRDGQFVYRINLNPAYQPKKKYNFLRHAGTVYALASYDRTYPHHLNRDAVRRATDYLKKFAIAPLPDNGRVLAVWSDPTITRSRKPMQAKLGGTGLGLVALLSVENIMPGTTSIDYLRKLAEFIIFMQKTDGSFFSKYIPKTGGRDDSWTSLYYPGEAALGLLMLYEKDPSIVWLQAAADGIAHLARKRKGLEVVEADHWALLATAKLLPLYDRCRQPVPREAILDHAVQICDSIVYRIPDKSASGIKNQGYVEDGRTTPTATRLEGMLAILEFLPADERDLRKRMVDTIHGGVRFLLRSQIRSGNYAGAMPRAIHPLPRMHPLYSKAFNRRATEVRIDYVQHALSAMLQYEARFYRTYHQNNSKSPKQP